MSNVLKSLRSLAGFFESRLTMLGFETSLLDCIILPFYLTNIFKERWTNIFGAFITSDSQGFLHALESETHGDVLPNLFKVLIRPLKSCYEQFQS